MVRLNAMQRKLLQNLASATRECWTWQNLWVFIESEAESGAFRQYSGPQAHFDPDKAKADRFGRELVQLHKGFRKSAAAAWPRFEDAYDRCIKAGIPVAVVDKYEARGRLNKSNAPSMEKLLLYMPRHVPLSVAKKQLRDAIRNADPRTPQREINILAKYSAALEKKTGPHYQKPNGIGPYERRIRRRR